MGAALLSISIECHGGAAFGASLSWCEWESGPAVQVVRGEITCCERQSKV